ncbi:hypothetical protein KS461_10075 [Pseudomonas chlororaphis]|uniref:phage collar protein n=1 Tax=Pseudomonas chlororaphis TaxID=587753 RepID=UPI000F6D0213|nr:hypothetical protein [Pseudomonas chlororaphis]AZD85007.1 hypothetical protein C4K14_2173 [Pseudomonas chlororaphis subsp. aureofaciens]UVE47608.1 hypothetical protein KS461_10075 [Pseudomonas chlororaphis]
MIIPGSNLLNIALGVIGTQAATWHQAIGRTENKLGQLVADYADPVTVQGSMQSVDRMKYQALGLDLAKSYYNFYASTPIDGIARGESPDLIDYNGRRHEVVNVLNWSPQDGWRGVMIVDVGPVP